MGKDGGSDEEQAGPAPRKEHWRRCVWKCGSFLHLRVRDSSACCPHRKVREDENGGSTTHSSSSSVPKLWPQATTWNIIFLPNWSLE